MVDDRRSPLRRRGRRPAREGHATDVEGSPGSVGRRLAALPGAPAAWWGAVPHLQDGPRIGATALTGVGRRRGVDHPGDRRPHGGTQENLPGRGRVAQPLSLIHDRPERGIVHPPGAAEEPEGGLALGNAHAQIQRRVLGLPAVAHRRQVVPHRDGHAHGLHRRIATGQWGIEDHPHACAGELLQGPLPLHNLWTEDLVVIPEDVDHPLGGRGRGKGREPLDSTTDDRNLPARSWPRP